MIDWSKLNARAQQVRRRIRAADWRNILSLLSSGCTWKEIVELAGDPTIIETIAWNAETDEARAVELAEALKRGAKYRRAKVEMQIESVENVDDNSVLVQRHKLLLKLTEETSQKTQDSAANALQALGKGIGEALIKARATARKGIGKNAVEQGARSVPTPTALPFYSDREPQPIANDSPTARLDHQHNAPKD